MNAIQLSTDDVEYVERIASRQSILYIYYIGLKKLGYEDLLSEKAEYSISKAAFDFVQREEALKCVSKALDDSGIEYVPLKGAILNKLYPQPCMRSSSDIDVLVREDNLEDAIKAIESSTDFKSYLRAHHDVQFINKRVHLELHFSLLANLENLDSVLEAAWDYVSHDSETNMKAFTPEFQIFYITAHAAKHFIREGGIGIRPLLDLWLLRAKTEYNEERVRALCNAAGILGYYMTCCDLLSVWFEGNDYSEVTKSFESIVMSGGVFGSSRLRVVSHERRNRGRKYILTRVFRKGSEIQEIYPICKKHPILVPGYQVVRWTNLLRPSKREAARKELKQRREIDQTEIKKYDQLLKSMGL